MQSAIDLDLNLPAAFSRYSQINGTTRAKCPAHPHRTVALQARSKPEHLRQNPDRENTCSNAADSRDPCGKTAFIGQCQPDPAKHHKKGGKPLNRNILKAEIGIIKAFMSAAICMITSEIGRHAVMNVMNVRNIVNIRNIMPDFGRRVMAAGVDFSVRRTNHAGKHECHANHKNNSAAKGAGKKKLFQQPKTHDEFEQTLISSRFFRPFSQGSVPILHQYRDIV